MLRRVSRLVLLLNGRTFTTTTQLLIRKVKSQKVYGFGAFMIKAKNNRRLKNLGGKKRGKMLGKMWKELTSQEKSLYSDIGKTMSFKIQIRPPRRKPRRAHAFNKFVMLQCKKNAKVKMMFKQGKNLQAMKFMAQLWKSQKAL